MLQSPEQALDSAMVEIRAALQVYHENLEECLEHIRDAHHHIEQAAEGVEEQL